jgi:hypothetical protein
MRIKASASAAASVVPRPSAPVASSRPQSSRASAEARPSTAWETLARKTGQISGWEDRLGARRNLPDLTGGRSPQVGGQPDPLVGMRGGPISSRQLPVGTPVDNNRDGTIDESDYAVDSGDFAERQTHTLLSLNLPEGLQLTGAGQHVVQIGSEGTPAAMGAYLSPETQHSNVNMGPSVGDAAEFIWGKLAGDSYSQVVEAMFEHARDSGATTVVVTTPFANGNDVKETILHQIEEGQKQNPPVTFIIPSNIIDDPNDPHYAANQAEFIQELQEAGAIVVGTTTPPGRPDGQPGYGQNTVIVDTWEHSTAASTVSNAVAIMKQHDPSISSAEIAAALAAGGNPLDLTLVFDHLGIPHR